MEVCDDGHPEIVHSDRHCPFCLEMDRLREAIEERDEARRERDEALEEAQRDA